jgi:hypothetical protein
MSHFTPVLYGNRLYSRTLYEINEDFESATITLSDAMSVTDAQLLESINKALADLLMLTDSTTISSSHALSDTLTITDTLAKVLTRHLADSIALSDADVIFATKSLAEILTLLDSVILKTTTKSLVDTLTLTDQLVLTNLETLFDTLTLLDSQILTTTRKELTDFIDLKEWISVTLKRANPWQIVAATQRNIPMYGVVLYGQNLYGYTPDVVWNKPASNAWSKTNPSGSNFKNADGESHQ